MGLAHLERATTFLHLLYPQLPLASTVRAVILFYVSLLFNPQSGTIFLAGRFLHGVLSPLIHQRKGGERMSDYEMIMIQLTILSLVVGLLLALIKKDK